MGNREKKIERKDAYFVPLPPIFVIYPLLLLLCVCVLKMQVKEERGASSRDVRSRVRIWVSNSNFEKRVRVVILGGIFLVGGKWIKISGTAHSNLWNFYQLQLCSWFEQRFQKCCLNWLLQCFAWGAAVDYSFMQQLLKLLQEQPIATVYKIVAINSFVP